MKVGKHAKTHESQATCSKEGGITIGVIYRYKAHYTYEGLGDAKMII